MQKSEDKKPVRPAQKQGRQPGIESEMVPRPSYEGDPARHAGKLEGKKALITGGDSGIGRAVAVAFAREGADVAIAYLDEQSDAEETKAAVERLNKTCLLLPGDLSQETHCRNLVERTWKELGGLDIVVNNAAVQFPKESLEEISPEQLERTFRINIFAYFYVTQAALRYLKEGSSIINTTSVTAYRGSSHLIDYAATKGAIVSFTRSLASALAEKKIRVNGVAPGPIWTPLIPASFPPDHVAEFGSDVPLKRAGQPEEVAPCYVFLASEDASYMTGQVLHPNGGEIVNG